MALIVATQAEEVLVFNCEGKPFSSSPYGYSLVHSPFAAKVVDLVVVDLFVVSSSNVKLLAWKFPVKVKCSCQELEMAINFRQEPILRNHLKEIISFDSIKYA